MEDWRGQRAAFTVGHGESAPKRGKIAGLRRGYRRLAKQV